MKNTYVGIVDTEIPSSLEIEKVRLINKLQIDLGHHYMIGFSEEPLDIHPYILPALLDQFRREDNEYIFRGNIVGRDELVAKLKERYRALVLNCVTMETVPANFKVLEFTEEK